MHDLIFQKWGFLCRGESLLIILLVGVIAGWLAGVIVRGTGFGLVTDMCIGVVGAVIGSWLFPQVGIHMASRLASSIVTATVGALALLIVLALIRRGGRIRI